MNESNKEFLSWLRDRLINVYGESPGTDFVQKLTKIIEPIWTTEAPTTAGEYWFYGCPLMGEMGEDFTDHKVFRPRLCLVKVANCMNGIIATTNGHFMQLKKFNRFKEHSSGYLGYWTIHEPLDIPKDVEKCFENKKS